MVSSSHEQFDLVVELPVGVGSKEGTPDLGQHFLGDHVQPGLQGVVHLDLALLRIELDPSSTENR